MSDAVHEILDRIQRLPVEDRLLLEEHLARHAKAAWQREAELARHKGIDQVAIHRAADKVRLCLTSADFWLRFTPGCPVCWD